MLKTHSNSFAQEAVIYRLRSWCLALWGTACQNRSCKTHNSLMSYSAVFTLLAWRQLFIRWWHCRLCPEFKNTVFSSRKAWSGWLLCSHNQSPEICQDISHKMLLLNARVLHLNIPLSTDSITLSSNWWILGGLPGIIFRSGYPCHLLVYMTDSGKYEDSSLESQRKLV